MRGRCTPRITKGAAHRAVAARLGAVHEVAAIALNAVIRIEYASYLVNLSHTTT